MIVDLERDLLSIGRVAELLQASPREIERAAEVAGIEVALRIDGRPYFLDSNVARLRSVLSRSEDR